MRERLTDLLGVERAARITVGTFHQLGASLLQEFGEAIGVHRTFTILADADRQMLLKRACRSYRPRSCGRRWRKFRRAKMA